MLLLVVFVVSTFGKIRSRAAFSGFVRSVRDVGLVPDRSVRTVAACMVGGEAVVVALVAAPPTLVAGLLLAGVLLAIFTVSIVVTLRRGVRVACRCFGSSALPMGRRHVVRNVLLLAVAVLGGASLASAPGQPDPAGLIVAAVAGLLAAVVLVLYDEIVELFVGAVPSAGPLEKGRM